MKPFSNYLLLPCSLAFLTFFSCGSNTATKNEMQPQESSFDWKTYLSRPFLNLIVSSSQIQLLTLADHLSIINVLSLDFVSQDSAITRDSNWYNCRDKQQCYGLFLLDHSTLDSTHPTSVAVTYSINGGDSIVDTIPLLGVYDFINSISVSQDKIDSNLFSYHVSWNMARLGQVYGPYMVIRIGYSDVGTEYYESHPNYDNLPETSQPPDGHRSFYGRYSPEDNSFSFQSHQDAPTFTRTRYTAKRYALYDIRVECIE